jgi:two-component system nitrate/nitrite response regulator NarL
VEYLMSDTLSIVVVDDHPLYRAGVVRTLAEAGGITVVGEGGSAADALQLAEKARPHMILLDISMPGGGIEAARAITHSHPEIAIVMLTASEDDDDVMESLAAGARGYVLKGVGAHDLLTVIRSVASGGSYVPPSLASRLLLAMKAGGSEAGATDLLSTLTEREEQILRLVSDGRSNKEVGRELGLQEKTVKHHMTSILQKLQVRNRTEAAILARKSWD